MLPVHSLSDPCSGCISPEQLTSAPRWDPCWVCNNPAGFHPGSHQGLDAPLTPKHFSHLSRWQMIRHEWSFPCSRKRDMVTTSMATSSGSGWESGKGRTWWGWQQDLGGELSLYQGTDGSQAYIATQGPLPHTLLDFWRLVWEFGVKVSLRVGWGGANILSPPLALFLQFPNPNHSPLPLPFLSRWSWWHVEKWRMGG